jgi:hypothetical protein
MRFRDKFLIADEINPYLKLLAQNLLRSPSRKNDTLKFDLERVLWASGIRALSGSYQIPAGSGVPRTD